MSIIVAYNQTNLCLYLWRRRRPQASALPRLTVVLVVLLLFLGLDDRGRDAVEVALAVLRDLAPAVVGLLEHADLLERLADLALHGRGAVRVVRGAVAAAVAAAVQLGERADADVFPEVDVSCDRGCTPDVGCNERSEGKGRPERRASKDVLGIAAAFMNVIWAFGGWTDMGMLGKNP